MRFGVREICEVVLRAKAKQTLGNRTFYKNEPVLYFDTLKTSSLEGTTTTVYATGGRGNSRLIAWEGERTLTFNFQDALLSPESLSILSGAGLIEAGKNAGEELYVHTTKQVEVKTAGTITFDIDIEADETATIAWNGGRVNPVTIVEGSGVAKHAEADIFCMALDSHGNITVEPCHPSAVSVVDTKSEDVVTKRTVTITCDAAKENGVVLVDYYIKRTANVKQLEITADKFAGNYYLEASTLFRDEATGTDLPAEFIIPNGKIQSNFTFSMAATGDPSVFDFVMDAFPDYTKFNRTKKVLCAIQIIEDAAAGSEEYRENCGTQA